MLEASASCNVVCRLEAERLCFRERGEEESGVEGFKRVVKSMADEERCIRAKAKKAGFAWKLIVCRLSWGRIGCVLGPDGSESKEIRRQ